MTSKESEEKEKKMFNFKTNVPELDTENTHLFKAADVLEKMGNNPGLTADQFYKELALSELDSEDFQAVTLAAIAIETMMQYDQTDEMLSEPTIH